METGGVPWSFPATSELDGAKVQNVVASQLPRSVRAWIAAPAVLGHHSRSSRLGEPGAYVHTLASAGRRSFRSPSLPRQAQAGSCLGVYFTENQRRVLEPILMVLGDILGDSVRPVERKSLDIRATATGLVAGPATTLSAPGISQLTSAQRQDFTRAWLLGAIEFAYWDRFLTETPFSLALVANTQHWSTRALLAACRRRGVTTAYVPHAPTALTMSYADLPVSTALLRTCADRDYYRHLGAQMHALTIIGNPAAAGVDHSGAAVPPGLGKRLLYAVSPWGREDIRAQIRLIEEGCGRTPVDVAPHPRSDLRFLRNACPSHWTIRQDLTTQELLAHGYTHVVVAGSGVAVEAIAHGSLVANISTHPQYQRYLFHHYAPVCFDVRTAEDVAAFIASAHVLESQEGNVGVHTPAMRGSAAARAAAEALISHLQAGLPMDEMANDVWGPIWPDNGLIA